jgi:hypothetical protein
MSKKSLQFIYCEAQFVMLLSIFVHGRGIVEAKFEPCNNHYDFLCKYLDVYYYYHFSNFYTIG